MALFGGIPINFPSSMNVAVTNTPAVTVSGTVATTSASMSTLGTQKSYAVTLLSQQIPTIDIPANTKGAQIVFNSSNANDRLYVRYDGQPATVSSAPVTPLQAINCESLLDVQNLRFVGSVGSNIVVEFRG